MLVKLPEGLTCTQCVVQWKYHVGKHSREIQRYLDQTYRIKLVYFKSAGNCVTFSLMSDYWRWEQQPDLQRERLTYMRH